MADLLRTVKIQEHAAAERSLPGTAGYLVVAEDEIRGLQGLSSLIHGTRLGTWRQLIE